MLPKWSAVLCTVNRSRRSGSGMIALALLSPVVPNAFPIEVSVMPLGTHSGRET